MANEQGQGQGRQALVVGVIVVVRNTVHVAHKSVRVIQWSVHREMVVNKIWRCCWWCCTALVDHATSLEVRLSVTHSVSQSLSTPRRSLGCVEFRQAGPKTDDTIHSSLASCLVPFHSIPSRPVLSQLCPSIYSVDRQAATRPTSQPAD